MVNTSESKIERLLNQLDHVKQTGHGKWLACCPAHTDKSPSLAIKETADGKMLLHCFAGCPVTDIVAAVGLELSDLMPDNTTYRKSAKQPRFNRYELFEMLAFESVILSLAVRQLLNLEDLDEADLVRVLLAEDTINRIFREVG